MSRMEKSPFNEPASEGHLSQLWIAAYHDGELRGESLRQAEAHLAGCETCRLELEELRGLSSLLGSVPAVHGEVSAGSFVDEVMLRLPERPQVPWWQPLLKGMWKTAPAGLFALWAFFQAAIFLVQAMLWVPGRVSLTVGSMGVEQGMGLGSLVSAWHNIAGAYNLVAPMVNVLVINLVLTGLVAGLFWAWLASWWAVQVWAAKQNKGV